MIAIYGPRASHPKVHQTCVLRVELEQRGWNEASNIARRNSLTCDASGCSNSGPSAQPRNAILALIAGSNYAPADPLVTNRNMLALYRRTLRCAVVGGRARVCARVYRHSYYARSLFPTLRKEAVNCKMVCVTAQVLLITRPR